ncbi:MAG: hypothetical protein ABL921_14535 [Pirellula sp.]
MNKQVRSKCLLGVMFIFIAGVFSQGTSHADLVFSTGNIQYTNVNVNAEATAMTIMGEVGNTGVQVLFNGFGVGPTPTQLTLHGQHGVAFIEPATPSPQMYKLTVTAQSGWGFSAMDWKLDAVPGSNGTLNFTGLDSNNNAIPLSSGTSSFTFDANGQNPFNVMTNGGSLISTLVIESTIPIAHMRQLSVNITAVPEPSSIVTFGLLGMAAYLPLRRKFARMRLSSKMDSK